LVKLKQDFNWTEEKWQGIYYLNPLKIIDGSLRLKKNMYERGSFHCLSFQAKKRLPIGRGGMILTDDEQAYRWLKKASYDGRNPGTPWKLDSIEMVGYHYYMTPEDAARGLR
jgi:dTDP-4-amino-4,6-dideoxygalactose transaminase